MKPPGCAGRRKLRRWPHARGGRGAPRPPLLEHAWLFRATMTSARAAGVLNLRSRDLEARRPISGAAGRAAPPDPTRPPPTAVVLTGCRAVLRCRHSLSTPSRIRRRIWRRATPCQPFAAQRPRSRRRRFFLAPRPEPKSRRPARRANSRSKKFSARRQGRRRPADAARARRRRLSQTRSMQRRSPLIFSLVADVNAGRCAALLPCTPCDPLRAASASLRALAFDA